MMKNQSLQLFIFLAFLILSGSCENDSNSKNTKTATTKFEGLVVRDDFGTEYFIIEGTDDGDWQITDDFSDKELQLFNIDFDSYEVVNQKACLNQDSGRITTTPPDNYEVIAYPNPLHSILNIEFRLHADKDDHLKFVLVDSSFNVLFAHCNSVSQSLLYSLNLANIEEIEKDILYRIYYLTDDGEGNYSNMGHGDIMRSDAYSDLF